MDYSNDLCMGCMNKLNEDKTCSHCSYTADSPYIKIYLPPKTVLDERYLIGKVLSYNGEGASYIGYDMFREEKVVVREYMPESLCTRSAEGTGVVVSASRVDKYKTYMAEFAELNKVLSRMRNLSNIVPATDMFAANNTMYAVLPYIEGISLKKFLNSGNKLTWAQVKKLFPPMFTTLSLIHNGGVIHGGISPENIVVTTNGEVKLVGFSISATKVFNEDITADLNPGYAAPEQYQGSEWLGTYTDVFGICAVLYKILSGITPPSSIQRQDVDRIVPLWQVNPDVPKNVSNVIMQGLSVDHNERIQTITELVTGLFEQPELVQHKKGSTQLHAKQTAQTIDETDDGEEDEEGGVSLVKTVITAVILAIIVGVGLYLLASMFTPATDSSSSTTTITTTTEAATEQTTTESDDSSEEDETTTTTVDYGTGAVMPNLVGYDYESVISSIESDFEIVTTYVTSDEYDEGVIVSQSIPADVEYNPTGGLTLELEISSGSGKTELPSYTGVVSSDYLATLSDNGISYSYQYEYSDTVSYGVVSRVLSSDGTELNEGDEINTANGEQVVVYISLGTGE
ncbi:MAG: PASTA domain-containing protein [Ruminococcus sp.]|nr:PASTA domain-containing protein [Ruminococcus sp.]